VLAQLLYGFRISLAFGVMVSLAGYVIGIILGGAMDILADGSISGAARAIEIWSAIPFLYTIMILARLIHSTFWTLPRS